MSLKQQIQLDETYLIPAYKRKPVEFVRGEGIRLFDDTGKQYLDFFSGAGAVSVGHANPVVTRAIQQQAAKLLHVSNYYYVEGRGELAEKLSALLYAGPVDGQDGTQDDAQNNTLSDTQYDALGGSQNDVQNDAQNDIKSDTLSGTLGDTQRSPWRFFFANSGAEAIEGAIKLARKYGSTQLGGASTIISAKRSFHGRTLAALAATGQPSKQESFKPLPQGFVHVDINNIEGLKALLDEQSASEGPQGGVSAGEGPQGEGPQDEKPRTGAVCAVLLECIQGEGGVYPCTEEYLKEVRRLTAERKILLIIDEVQTGFFRTGTYPFAFQHAHVTPDVVTIAKGLGAGVPIGAFAAQGAAAEVLQPGDHGSTFGGSPLVIAAAHAVLSELERMDAATHVAEVGTYLKEQLQTLPLVIEIRGKGLMLGIELSEPVAEQAVAAGLEVGLVLNSIGQSILRFLPPLVCTKEDVDVLIEKLTTILKQG